MNLQYINTAIAAPLFDIARKKEDFKITTQHVFFPLLFEFSTVQVDYWLFLIDVLSFYEMSLCKKKKNIIMKSGKRIHFT